MSAHSASTRPPAIACPVIAPTTGTRQLVDAERHRVDARDHLALLVPGRSRAPPSGRRRPRSSPARPASTSARGGFAGDPLDGRDDLAQQRQVHRVRRRAVDREHERCPRRARRCSRAPSRRSLLTQRRLPRARLGSAMTSVRVLRVFTDRAGASGNPLGVVRDAGEHLPDAPTGDRRRARLLRDGVRRTRHGRADLHADGRAAVRRASDGRQRMAARTSRCSTSPRAT